MQIPGYRDLIVLGRGGFSTVYRALQESVQRDVALKVLAVHMAGADAKARFRRECATNGRVGTHPNIVTLFDSGFADDGSPYLAMQLCSGGSLSERVRASGRLPVPDVLRIGVKISAALQYAHSAGVLHRDIKPENILISEFGEPELADFGISSVDDQRLSTVTASSFTINHAAPEALAGRPSSVSSDLYSLCSTLFTLVSGHTPFTAPTSTALVALVNMVMNDPAPPTGRTDVPASLERLLAAGLSKAPADRPVDARAVGTTLQQIQQELGLPVTEFPSAPPPLAYSPTQTLWAPGGSPAAGLGPAAGRGPAAGGGGAAAAAGVPGGSGLGGGPVDTGDLPPTGAMPGGPIDTGDLPPTGAMPGGPIDTGDLPPTGGPIPPRSGHLPGLAPAGPPPPVQIPPAMQSPPLPPSGQWGTWAANVGARQQPGQSMPDTPRPRIPPAAIPVAVAPVPIPAPRPREPAPASRAWWWAAVVGTVVAVAVVAYFVAFRHPSASTTTGAGSSTTLSAKTTGATASTRRTGSTTRRPTTTSKPATAPAAIASFSAADSTVSCASATAVVRVPLTWTATDVTQVWIAVDVSSGDASKSPDSAGLPAIVGPGHDPAAFDISYHCAKRSQTVYLTVLGSAGKVTRHLTLQAVIAQTTTSATTTPATSTSITATGTTATPPPTTTPTTSTSTSTPTSSKAAAT